MPAFVMLYFNFIFTVAKNAEHFQIFIGHCVYPFEDCLFSYLANLLIRRFFSGTDFLHIGKVFLLNNLHCIPVLTHTVP